MGIIGFLHGLSGLLSYLLSPPDPPSKTYSSLLRASACLARSGAQSQRLRYFPGLPNKHKPQHSPGKKYNSHKKVRHAYEALNRLLAASERNC